MPDVLLCIICFLFTIGSVAGLCIYLSDWEVRQDHPIVVPSLIVVTLILIAWCVTAFNSHFQNADEQRIVTCEKINNVQLITWEIDDTVEIMNVNAEFDRTFDDNQQFVISIFKSGWDNGVYFTDSIATVVPK